MAESKFNRFNLDENQIEKRNKLKNFLLNGSVAKKLDLKDIEFAANNEKTNGLFHINSDNKNGKITKTGYFVFNIEKFKSMSYENLCAMCMVNMIKDLNRRQINEITNSINEPKFSGDRILSNQRILFNALTEYFKKYIKDNCKQEIENLDESLKIISEGVAKACLEQLTEEEILGILNGNNEVKMDNLDKIINKVASTLPSNESLYTQGVNGKKIAPVGDLLLDKNNVPKVGNSWEQQTEALSENKNLTLDNLSNDVENFCKNYVRTFMNANGLKEIAVTFNNEGELGTFFDNGGADLSININLSKLSGMSKTEVLMTLSHELTHAVDCAINKANGFDGLQNNCDEEIGAEKGEPEYEDLKELCDYCYYVNPNERHARIGELSGLKLSIDMNGGITPEIAQSIKLYQAYQQTTISKLNGLEEFLQKMNLKYQNSKHPKIQERLNYLNNLVEKGLTKSDADKKALDEANQLI
ncbi:MAG: hypothetical protein IJ538_05030 [Clostridia bacterium]|nr:hypothetical protein [Clostridia bacterium]